MGYGDHQWTRMEWTDNTLYDYYAGDQLLPRQSFDSGADISLLLGVFITIVPKLLPRILPALMVNSQPEIRAKFDSPDFVENNEAMLQEEFSKYFQIIEDIVDTIDGQSLTKSSDYTGFKKFLLGCLEALDIDISRFMGEIEISKVKMMGAVARGEAPNSQLHSMIADAIIAAGTFIYNSLWGQTI